MAIYDDFMFLDPPYDCIFSDYGNAEHKDGFNERNHTELANTTNNELEWYNGVTQRALNWLI